MKINDIEVDFDFYNEDDAKKLEVNLEKCQDNINKLNTKDLSQSEFLKSFRLTITECFNNLFGEEKSKEILKDSKNFMTYIDAFKDLVHARTEQEKYIQNEIATMQQDIDTANLQYSSNRATRRSK